MKELQPKGVVDARDRFQKRADGESEPQRRTARAFDKLSAALVGEDGLDRMLTSLLEMFMELARPQAAVIRLREGESFRARAAIGLEEEIAAGFSTALHETTPDGASAPVVFELGPASPWRSKAISDKAFRTVVCVRLQDRGEVVGVLCLAFSATLAPPDLDKALLAVIAERAAAGITRQRTRDALENAVVARDEVLAVVAHDLRNPLNVITLAANSMLQRSTDTAARRPLERILRGARRADRLIADLLEVTAIEGGRLTLDRRPVDPADLVLSAIEIQQSVAESASVIINADVTPGLPLVDGDSERLMEVLENLVGNAVKFTRAGGSVTVGASVKGSTILFWVKDNGCGVPAEQLPHLFDRFWQGRKRDRRGTGLGLTICKGIVEAHGGRVWVDSEVGAGTTVFFTVPADSSQREGETLPTANVLVVDDRPENLLSMQAILERPDYRVVTARSGEEALRLALREQFTVALIDVAMPGMNGLEVAVHLKALERSRDIPIIFITAFGDDPEEIHRAYSAGGADYLVKPLDPQIVRKKVAVFVDLSRRRQNDPGTRKPRGSTLE